MKISGQDDDATAASAKRQPATSFRRLRRDITVAILIKLALLSLLGFVCFSSSQRPHIDASAVATRILPSR